MPLLAVEFVLHRKTYCREDQTLIIINLSY